MSAQSGRKLLVTGASGLLGLNLGVQMAARYAVTGIANSHPLAGLPFELLRADLSRPGAFEAALEQVKPDWVLHAAALASPGATRAGLGVAYDPDSSLGVYWVLVLDD